MVDFGVTRVACLVACSIPSASSSFSSSSVTSSTEVLLAALVATGIDTSCSCDLRVPREPRTSFCPRADAGEDRGSVNDVIPK